jgi:hypothetical protein
VWAERLYILRAATRLSELKTGQTSQYERVGQSPCNMYIEAVGSRAILTLTHSSQVSARDAWGALVIWCGAWSNHETIDMWHTWRRVGADWNR